MTLPVCLKKRPGDEQWLQDTAAVLEERGAHWSHWSWKHEPKAPLNDTFDCNTQKTGIYETMKTIFEGTRR